MIPEKQNTGALKSALASLDRLVQFALSKDERTSAPVEFEAARMAVIQAFEFTYELCWKQMKRWMEFNYSASGMESRRELYRRAAEYKLIQDVDKWMEFHGARNQTSHTYDGSIAEDVFAAACEFLPYGKDFFSRLEARL